MARIFIIAAILLASLSVINAIPVACDECKNLEKGVPIDSYPIAERSDDSYPITADSYPIAERSDDSYPITADSYPIAERSDDSYPITSASYPIAERSESDTN